MHNPHERSIQTLLVASPVPDVHRPALVGIKGERLKRAHELLKSDSRPRASLQPFIAFKETILPQKWEPFLIKLTISCVNGWFPVTKPTYGHCWTKREGRRRLATSSKLKEPIKKSWRRIPDNPQAWTEFGSLLRSAEKYDKALKAYHKAGELKARPDLWRHRCDFPLCKRLDQAKRYLSKFLKTDVDPVVCLSDRTCICVS